MDSTRKTAIIVGLLFIVATVSTLVSSVFLGSIYDPNYLTAVSANENQVLIAVLIWLVAIASIVSIPILMYPILKKYKVSMALGFVVGPLAIRNWGYGMVAPIVFSIGSLMFYYLMYKSKLIPHWLSVWGLIGATLFLASAFLPLLSYVSSTTLVYLHLTGAVNQMVLAAWLIVKGFNSSAILPSQPKSEQS